MAEIVASVNRLDDIDGARPRIIGIDGPDSVSGVGGVSNSKCDVTVVRDIIEGVDGISNDDGGFFNAGDIAAAVNGVTDGDVSRPNITSTDTVARINRIGDDNVCGRINHVSGIDRVGYDDTEGFVDFITGVSWISDNYGGVDVV